MRHFDRRDFLRASATASGLLTFAALDGSVIAEDKAKNSNGKGGDINSQLRVACVGVHGRGMDHVGGFAGNARLNTIVTHICDADEGVIGKAMKVVEDRQKKSPKFEQDIRKLLEDKSIDIISIATPNHWHALAAIWAMQHGKDVYVEKPVSHNVREGRMIVETARKLGKICQTGTQSRSQKGMRDAMAYVHSGKLGKVYLSRGLCYKSRPSIGKVKEATPIPRTCDYNLWCGPAPVKPLMRKSLHYDWHWVWDTGNGDLGNQGIHEMDKARWGLARMELPRSAVSIGGRFGYVDDGETANTQICLFDYGDCELIFEVRGLPTPKLLGAGVGNIFYGTEGYVVCPSYSSGVAYDKDGKKLEEFKGGGDHYGNFINAVRERKHELLNADILEGHLSSAMCHLGNISYRLGKPTAFSEAKRAFGEDKDGFESVKRMLEHLKDNKIDMDATKFALGRKLMIDAKTETFLNDKEANDMLTREYRKGFVVPDKV
jgi:Oxidoreductase family, C-terminal alpha/beta domain/Oxidoreductase family, NAD-binding Rossmann fold